MIRVELGRKRRRRSQGSYEGKSCVWKERHNTIDWYLGFLGRRELLVWSWWRNGVAHYQMERNIWLDLPCRRARSIVPRVSRSVDFKNQNSSWVQREWAVIRGRKTCQIKKRLAGMSMRMMEIERTATWSSDLLTVYELVSHLRFPSWKD